MATKNKKPLLKRDELSLSQHQPSQITDIQDDTTEEQSMESNSDASQSQGNCDEDMDDLIKEETQNWLALHGPKLFALECSKFLSRERKRQDLRKLR